MSGALTLPPRAVAVVENSENSWWELDSSAFVGHNLQYRLNHAIGIVAALITDPHYCIGDEMTDGPWTLTARSWTFEHDFGFGPR